MYDGSSLAYEENIGNDQGSSGHGKACNADVEAEIGIVRDTRGKTFAINDVSERVYRP